MAENVGSITENLASFTGSGGFFVLLAVSVLYLFFFLKEKEHRPVLVWLPVAVMLVFFCPLWIIYIKKSVDGEILYRILWLIPMGAVICVALTHLISKLGEKLRPVAFAGAVLVLVLAGEYIYKDVGFKKAENIYHIPETVVKLCDEIHVEGREIKACFPKEFVTYVRQYDTMIFLTYGRNSYMPKFEAPSDLKYLLQQEKIDTSVLAELLRDTHSPYLILASDRVLTEDILNYDFSYVKTIDGYDIYLDNREYIGID